MNPEINPPENQINPPSNSGTPPTSEPPVSPSVPPPYPEYQTPAPSFAPPQTPPPISPTPPAFLQPTQEPTPQPATQNSVPVSPNPIAPQPVNNGSGNRKVWIIVIVAIVAAAILIGGGILAFSVLFKQVQRNTVTSAVNNAASRAKSSATDISSLNKLTFNITPSAVANLQPNDLGVPTIKQYYTADRSCFAAFGTASANNVASSSVADTVNNYLNSIRKAGGTVSGPDAIDPRIIKGTDGKEYSITSLTFGFSQGTEQIKGNFSVAALKSGDRVVIETACDNKTSAVDDSKMTSIESVIKQLTLTPQ